MHNLGEDLALLSITPDRGIPLGGRSLEFGLMGSELVRLAALGRIGMVGDVVAIRDLSPVGDAELDLALRSLAQAGHLPQARAWVSMPRPGIADAYLARLARSGVIRPEERKFLRFIKYTAWRITDPGRYASVRGTLDAIAQPGGWPVTASAAAFAGLAHAAGVVERLYPGSANVEVRRRFEQIAKGTQSGPAARAAREAAGLRPGSPTDTEPASNAAFDAAMFAATEAATQAAVQAATEAAVHATAHAAAHASTHSSSDSGISSHSTADSGHHHHH